MPGKPRDTRWSYFVPLVGWPVCKPAAIALLVHMWTIVTRTPETFDIFQVVKVMLCKPPSCIVLA